MVGDCKEINLLSLSLITAGPRRVSPGSSRKFDVLRWRPRWVCWKFVSGPMSSFETFVCWEMTLSLEPRLESLFSTKYARPPFELPRLRCFWGAFVGVTFPFSLRNDSSSWVKSLVDFLCFRDTTLSLHVLSSVEWELCKACCGSFLRSDKDKQKSERRNTELVAYLKVSARKHVWYEGVLNIDRA